VWEMNKTVLKLKEADIKKQSLLTNYGQNFIANIKEMEDKVI
jgi:hypothetical protein